MISCTYIILCYKFFFFFNNINQGIIAQGAHIFNTITKNLIWFKKILYGLKDKLKMYNVIQFIKCRKYQNILLYL